MDYYLADKPYQFELMLVSPCGLANHTGEAPELGSDNGIVNTLTGMADVDGTSSNHTFSPGTFVMANITTRKKKKDCVKKKKHRKAQNRDGCTYQKSKVERSLNTKYDLAITVLYGEWRGGFEESISRNGR